MKLIITQTHQEQAGAPIHTRARRDPPASVLQPLQAGAAPCSCTEIASVPIARAGKREGTAEQGDDEQQDRC